MEQTSEISLEALLAKETWTAEDSQLLCGVLAESADAPDKMKEILSDMQQENPDPKGGVALKIGIASYLVAKFDLAVQAFEAATDNKDRRYFQAMTYKALRQYTKAIEEFQRAKSKGWDAGISELQILECKLMAQAIDNPEAELKKLESATADTAEFHCVAGLIKEVSGDIDGAEEEYEAALDIKEECPEALFRLAYLSGRYGDDEEAVELYNQCLQYRPTYVSALMNLAILYGDQGDYDKELVCIRRVLAANPSHERARLYLKDAQSSKTMFYDEDEARQRAQHNAILETPVSDFELSVRARNCLKKMDINSLGDLVRTPESKLLEYKNFGETSLREIREMLHSRGLRVGQALEEQAQKDFQKLFAAQPKKEIPTDGANGIPLEQVEFSVRSRAALENLGIRTLGELASKSETELLSCRNFGLTSLNEIKLRLEEYGLALA